jgi:acyl carrier protein
MPRELGAGVTEHSMEQAEALEVFTRALSLPHPQLVVSAVSLPERQAFLRATFGRRDAVHEDAAPVAAADWTPEAVEETVAELFARLLQQDPVPREEDFFALGGDSLMVLDLIAHCKKTFGIELSLADIFDALSVAALAALCTKRIEEVSMRRARTFELAIGDDIAVVTITADA